MVDESIGGKGGCQVVAFRYSPRSGAFSCYPRYLSDFSLDRYQAGITTCHSWSYFVFVVLETFGYKVRVGFEGSFYSDGARSREIELPPLPGWARNDRRILSRNIRRSWQIKMNFLTRSRDNRRIHFQTQQREGGGSQTWCVPRGDTPNLSTFQHFCGTLFPRYFLILYPHALNCPPN